jgi:hypothetical protein
MLEQLTLGWNFNQLLSNSLDNLIMLKQLTIGNNFKAAEMQTVIDNYKKLGYTINRKSADGVSLYWLIGW